MFSYNTGINDFQNFVRMALQTSASEGDLANDNLSRLAIVGSGYCPFIYDLKADADCDDFMDCCTKVWEALQLTPSLTENLVC